MNLGHTAEFNTAKHKKAVADMKARRLDVHEEGKKVFRETGKMEANVDVKGQKRVSHNAMTPDGSKCILTNGVSLPIIVGGDGTGSMGENVKKVLFAMGLLNDMLGGVRDRYFPQIATAILQDVGDEHPPFQMSQFESDNRISEQIKLLVPDKEGGDSTEDYDLGLAYIHDAVDTDIVRYGLKGYLFIIADADGRGYVSADAMKHYFDIEWQNNSSTSSICSKLLDNWHVYQINVNGSRTSIGWWSDQLGGRDRIVRMDDSDLLAELIAGLIFVTETVNPTKEGLSASLKAEGKNETSSDRDIDIVWRWLQDISSHFGDQAKLPNYGIMPKPGDIFANYRHAWPIGHVKEAENADGPIMIGDVSGSVESLPWGEKFFSK